MSRGFEWVSELFAAPAAHQLYGEDVTIAEHMLQTAAAASAEGAPDELVLAALLHDVGHFVDDRDADAFGNRHHAAAGAALIEPRFGPTVSKPVALHVAAKRYLVAAEPGYADRLSPASVETLHQQGGPFDAAAIARFRAVPGANGAIALRRWDDTGKVAGVSVAPLSTYRLLVEHLAR